jgi:hypothetical protein
MITLTDALEAAREKRQSEHNDKILQWQLAQGVLQALGERLNAANLSRWYFIPSGEEIIVIYQPGDGTKQRVGTWSVDSEYRLMFGEEKTEWVTKESWRRVIDKAVVAMAEIIAECEAQNAPFEPVVVPLTGNPRPQDNAG